MGIHWVGRCRALSSPLEFQKSIFGVFSEQSRIARSRNKVIRMLFVLFLVQVICWGPWQFHVVYDAYVWYNDPLNEPVNTKTISSSRNPFL